MARVSKTERNTNETKIKIDLNLDGTGKSNIFTEIGFFDHMLTLLSKHGFMDLYLEASGDVEVDSHHTIEDVGIVLGKAILEAIGDKQGISRYGQAIIPMDETLVMCALDFSGRPYLNFQADFTVPKLGMLDTEMVEEFFRAVSVHAGLNLHIKVLDGKNNHHIAEGIFKAFAKALDMAKTIDPRISGTLSTKGMLE